MIATNRARHLALVAGLAGLAMLAGCSDLGGEPRTAVAGKVTVGNGVVFLERGHVWQGHFERFGLIDEQGRFEVELPVGGPWGVHLYFNGFFYMPLEVEVREGYTTPVEQPAIAWSFLRKGAWTGSGIQPADQGILEMVPDDTTDTNPSITDPTVTFRSGSDLYQASVLIEDPSGNLSLQTLLGHEETGLGLQLNAPAPPVNDNYPDGLYTASVYLPEWADPLGPWWFVAADHDCQNSAVMRVIPTEIE